MKGDVDAHTLGRFEAHRLAWAANPALREQYRVWYRKVADALPRPALGRFVEIGSGPGFAKEFIPTLELSDVVRAPWHDHEVSADVLPFANGSVGALVLFDVLHHLSEPAKFFSEAVRVLPAGGRVILCEPYLSPLSLPVYKFLHEEGATLRVDPLSPGWGDNKRPFDGNQAVPTLLFTRKRHREAFAARFPSLQLVVCERFAGVSYPASGGFGRAPLLPMPLWAALHRFEDRLPELAFRLFGFRMLVVLERIS